MKPASNPAFLRQLSPSNALLVTAAGSTPESSALAWERWKSLFRNDGTKTTLAAVSREEQTLLPTVAWNLRTCVDSAELTEALTARRRVAIANLLAVSRLQKVLTILEGEGIFPLLLKGGALLSSVCYDDLAARRMADFDLLVAPDDADAALRTLESHGQERFGREDFDLSTIRSVMHAAALQGPLGELDVHWTLLYHSRRLNADREVIQTATTATLGGLTVTTPEPSQLAFHLLAHARLPDLRWLVDINHLLRRSAVDPYRVAELARERLYLQIVRHNAKQLASALPNEATQTLVEAVHSTHPKRGDNLHMEFTDAREAGQRARALTHFAKTQLRAKSPTESVVFLRELSRFATGAPTTRVAVGRFVRYAVLRRTRADTTKAS